MNSDPSSNQDRQISSSTSESIHQADEERLDDSMASELADLALDSEVEAASASTETSSEPESNDIWFDDEDQPERIESSSSAESETEASSMPVHQLNDTELEETSLPQESAIDTETASAAVTDSEDQPVIPAIQPPPTKDNTDISETPSTATEPETTAVEADQTTQPESLEIEAQVNQLQRQKQTLLAEVQALQDQKNQLLSQQLQQVQSTLSQLIQENTQALQQEKQTLQSEIERLQRRRDRIAAEMRTNFAGVSQDLAIRVQGFKQYLVGSLQDLAAAAEQLDLPQYQSTPPTPRQQPSPEPSMPPAGKNSFAAQTKRIRQLLDQYRTRPDYYGPPWQLRRTFEPIHAERVQDWFIDQGGKGAIRSMGSRLQNILIASAVISIMHQLHGNRCYTLILSDTPERLGEWRRGLQDCLGISRSDFGPNRGVVLFETPEPLVQRAERLVNDRALPLIIIDETEEKVNLSLLQFPLWLAFAPDPQQMSSYSY